MRCNSLSIKITRSAFKLDLHTAWLDVSLRLVVKCLIQHKETIDEATEPVKDRIKYKQVQVKGGRKLTTGVRNHQRLLQKLVILFYCWGLRKDKASKTDASVMNFLSMWPNVVLVMSCCIWKDTRN
jgi:hypothetical protein